MATTVVSGFSLDGYRLYGKQFIETFHQFATPGYDLVVYTPKKVPMPRGKCVLHSALDGAHAFIEKYKGFPKYNGRAPVYGWLPKDERVGYSYRFDAIRFCWQLFYPEHAIGFLNDGDILAWFDGDVIFTEQMPSSFIETTLAGVDLAYLGRVTHTELGYWAVRVGPHTRALLKAMADMYRTGQIFRLEEWHSAYVFDMCRQLHFWGSENNMTPGKKGKVWSKTPLADFCIHLKGKLKYEQHTVCSIPHREGNATSI